MTKRTEALIVFPGGWGAELAERFEASADDEYEENLKRCRLVGHDLESGIMGDGREWMRCARCRTRFEECE